MDCTNGSEIKALFKGTKKTKIFRRFLESAGRPSTHPTPIYEDNDATIAQILKDRLTPRIKHLDIPMTILHEDHRRGVYVAAYCPTDLNISDVNIKPHGGVTLQKKIMWTTGYRYYPPAGSEHYKLLELDKYKIGCHRGSFRKDLVYKAKTTTPTKEK